MTHQQFVNQDKQTLLRDLLAQMKGYEEKRMNIDSISSNYHHLKSTSGNKARILSMLHEGMGYYTNGETHKALKTYNEILNIEIDADAYYNKGLISFDENDFIQAFNDFTAAILLFPSYANAFHNRGLCALQIFKVAKIMNDTRFLSFHEFAKRDFEASIHFGNAISREFLSQIVICGGNASKGLEVKTVAQEMLQLMIDDDYSSVLESELIDLYKGKYNYNISNNECKEAAALINSIHPEIQDVVVSAFQDRQVMMTKMPMSQLIFRTDYSNDSLKRIIQELERY